MRIAYLTQSYPPMISGAAISAQQTAESMAQLGHPVLVIAASDQEYPYHVYTDNLTVLRLRSFNNPMRVGQRLLAFPSLKIMKALDQFRPDVIHSHEPMQMGMLALGYAKRARIPVTLTTHQLPWFVASYLPESLRPFMENILWSYARLTLKKYTTLIAPTETTSMMINQMTGLKPFTISYGLDLRKFHPPLSPNDDAATRQEWDLPSRVPLILHVGRLDTDKSVDKVIQAAAQPIRESEAHLLIVGDGCQKNNLIRLCRDLGIGNRVHFTGYISQQDGLPDIYRLCKVFVTASEIETQGIVLLEAAASGLPIVAVNATCIPEIVHHRMNGFLTRSGHINDFSNAVMTVLNNHPLAHRMGREGRILAEEHDIHHTWALHENLYREMIKHTPTQRRTNKARLFNPWKAMKTWMGYK